MPEQLHASANPWASDRDPQATARAVLAELAKLPQFLGLTTRQLQHQLYGTQKVGAGPVHSALGRLANDKLVERARWDGKPVYRITSKGRLWNDAAEVFEGGAA